MNQTGDIIKTLIAVHGKRNGYPEKSYLKRWCDDFDVNYTQWSAYSNDGQKLGSKIIDLLMDIFPDLNLNWFLKDDPNMFLSQESEIN